MRILRTTVFKTVMEIGVDMHKRIIVVNVIIFLIKIVYRIVMASGEAYLDSIDAAFVMVMAHYAVKMAH
jgi:hypothetical protein